MTQQDFMEMLRENHKSAFITKKEVAKELHISTGTVDALRRDGQIMSRKVIGQVMFDIGEVARFMAEA